MGECLLPIIVYNAGEDYAHNKIMLKAGSWENPKYKYETAIQGAEQKFDNSYVDYFNTFANSVAYAYITVKNVNMDNVKTLFAHIHNASSRDMNYLICAKPTNETIDYGNLHSRTTNTTRKNYSAGTYDVITVDVSDLEGTCDVIFGITTLGSKWTNARNNVVIFSAGMITA